MRHSESPLNPPAEHSRSQLGRLIQTTLLLLSAWALWGCSGAYCSGGNCNCDQNNECIVSCEGDGCDLGCANTADSCGAICGNECRFECSDTNHCSSLSRDNSVIECHNVPSCAARCGANCQYSAYSVSEARIQVGPGSSVECKSLALCDVECEGDCELNCTSVDRCELECLDGATKRTDQGGGRITCD